MITVGKMGKMVPPNAVFVRADRKSDLGNPFPMRDESQRDLVCDQFEAWMHKQLETNKQGKFVSALRVVWKQARTNDVHLVCWCAPKDVTVTLSKLS
jgi:hypothetical protein